MNASKKLMCMLAAGTALAAATPAFADSWRERGYDYRRDHRHYRMHEQRDFRVYQRGYDRRHVVVVPRRVVVAPRRIIVERPLYYAAPAPVYVGIGPATIIGAAIGDYIDRRQ